MFSPESSEMSSGGDTVPDLGLSGIGGGGIGDIGIGDIGIGGIGGGGGIGGSTMFLPESAEGPSRGDSPDLKRQREKKMEIYEELEHKDFLGSTMFLPESVEGPSRGDSPDPKRQRTEKKMDIYEEQEESIEVDEADDGMDKEIYEEQEQKDFLTEDDEESIKVDKSFELDINMESLLALHNVPEDGGYDVKTDNLDEIKKPKMSEEEIKEILEKVERETDESACVQHNSHMTAYLLPEGYHSIPSLEVNGESLEMYYMRLVPNVEYKRILFDPFRWVSLPDRDAQYVSLFSELNKCGSFEEISYHSYLDLPEPTRSKNFDLATEMADDLNLGKLTPSDIAKCLLDVFSDRDIIAAHLLKAEYDLYLLDCRFDQSLRPEDFTPKEDPPHPIFYSNFAFCPSAQQMDFDLWMENVGGSKMKKEECQNAIRARHKKNCEEDCTIRIRYIKLKRTIAKKLRLIPEED